MKTEEVINEMKSLSISTNDDFFKKYEAIAIAIKALEKRIPKKPLYTGDGYWNGEIVYDTWTCPSCGTDYEVDYDDYDYCPHCGQAIDWSDEE